MSEPTTDKPDKPRSSWAAGCLFGVVLGMVGSVLGCYWEVHIGTQQAVQMRAEGHSDDFLPVTPVAGTFLGGYVGWLFGWLLTAFLRGRLPLWMTVALLLLAPFGMAALIIMLFAGP
jgi:hypothetical protein